MPHSVYHRCSENFLEHGLSTDSTGIVLPSQARAPLGTYLRLIFRSIESQHCPSQSCTTCSQKYIAPQNLTIWVLTITDLRDICVVTFAMKPKCKCEKTSFDLWPHHPSLCSPSFSSDITYLILIVLISTTGRAQNNSRKTFLLVKNVLIYLQYL